MRELSQNTLVKTTPSQSLLSLNMRNVNELFLGFTIGAFAVLYGSQSVLSLSSLLCVRAQLSTQLGGLGSNVIFVDGGNTFRLYQIARLARLYQLDPTQTLERIYISRAFTAYQMTALILEKLKETIKQYDAKLARAHLTQPSLLQGVQNLGWSGFSCHIYDWSNLNIAENYLLAEG
jgi:hypothetical protein